MKKSVKIATHPETGAVITWNEKPGKDGKTYGKLRLEQVSLDMEGGVINLRKRSAFKTIEQSVAEFADFQEGQSFPGQIIRKETFAPQYEGHKEKVYPDGHKEAGKPFLVNGKKVYFQDLYTEDMSKQDILLKAKTTTSNDAEVTEAVTEATLTK